MLRLATIFLIATTAAATAATYTDKATKLRFPEKIGAWTRTDVHKYPQASAGTSISYKHALSGVITLYIYTNGVKKIPTGGNNDIVRGEFESVVQEIESVYGTDEYKDFRTVMTAAPEVQAPDGRTATLLASVHNYTNPETHPATHVSFALLTGYRNRFVKLRYTLPGDIEKTPERGQNELKQFISGLVASNKQNIPAFFRPASPKKPKEEITEEMAVAAIEEFRADPAEALRRGAGAIIVKFAEASPDVLIRFDRKATPWLGKSTEERQGALLTAYVAGNLASQLKSRKKENDSYAGILQTIATYRQLQEADPTFRLESIEDLIGLEAQGRLKEHLESQ